MLMTPFLKKRAKRRSSSIRAMYVALLLAAAHVRAPTQALGVTSRYQPSIQRSVHPFHRATLTPMPYVVRMNGDEDKLPKPPKLSPLDTTDKFDQIAEAAAADGSAALVLGREPGTCDPFDPKSSEYCMAETAKEEGLRRRIRLLTLFFLWYVLNTAYNVGNKLVLTGIVPCERIVVSTPAFLRSFSR